MPSTWPPWAPWPSAAQVGPGAGVGGVCAGGVLYRRARLRAGVCPHAHGHVHFHTSHTAHPQGCVCWARSVRAHAPHTCPHAQESHADIKAPPWFSFFGGSINCFPNSQAHISMSVFLSGCSFRVFLKRAFYFETISHLSKVSRII